VGMCRLVAAAATVHHIVMDTAIKTSPEPQTQDPCRGATGHLQLCKIDQGHNTLLLVLSV